jgi:hypothetical protein
MWVTVTPDQATQAMVHTVPATTEQTSARGPRHRPRESPGDATMTQSVRKHGAINFQSSAGHHQPLHLIMN